MTKQNESEQSGKKSQREIRREKMEQEQRQKTLRIALPIGLVVLAILALVLYRVFEPEVAGIVKVDAAIANQHDADLTYDMENLPPLPPMGGPHNPAWQNCGVYTNPVEPQYAIHSMEHGAVWVTYRPDLSDADVKTLQDLARGKTYILLSPYPGLASPIVLTTWNIQLQVDSASDARIADFINRYKGLSPEAGASCSDGVGAPAFK